MSGKMFLIFTAGKEVCPETGRKHVQGCFTLERALSFRRLKRIFDRELNTQCPHLTPQVKCSLANRRYCKKDGKMWLMINGTKPVLRPGRLDISKVHEQYSNFHKFVVEQFEVYRRHPIAYKQYFVSKDAVYDADLNRDLTVHYYFGPAGTGKSRRANEEMRDRSDNDKYNMFRLMMQRK
jgi:hypothetical protein